MTDANVHVSTCDFESRIDVTNSTFNNKKSFHQQTGLKVKEGTTTIIHTEHNLDTAEKQTRNTWLVLKCDAGEGWRSLGPKVRKMKKYCMKLRKKELRTNHKTKKGYPDWSRLA
jgi:hypothetical protein